MEREYGPKAIKRSVKDEEQVRGDGEDAQGHRPSRVKGKDDKHARGDADPIHPGQNADSEIWRDHTPRGVAAQTLGAFGQEYPTVGAPTAGRAGVGTV